MSSLKTQAIQTALAGNWESAIAINVELLENDPKNIETLNRLAFAYGMLGKIKDARNLYEKVLTIDTYNPIALRGLKRLTKTQKASGSKQSRAKGSAPLGQFQAMFLEESGKTKVVDLVNVADPKIISVLRIGEILTLSVKRLKVFVLDYKREYIGMLPDDLGKRLIKFLKGGNSYEVYVKATKNHEVTVFIKEAKRATRFKNHPSFIPLGKSPSNLQPVKEPQSTVSFEESVLEEE